MWLYGSGFPKSMNIGLAIDKKNGIESKVIGSGKSGTSSRAYQSEETTTSGEYEIKKANNKWNGWGTALKPAFEPIIVARKPFKGSLVDNVIKYGVGGINIDECRVETDEKIKLSIRDTSSCSKGWNRPWMEDKEKDKKRQEIAIEKANNLGRFPANLILTYDDTDFEEVCGGFPNTKSNGGKQTTKNFKDYNGGNCNSYMNISNRKQILERIDTGYFSPCDSGSASRYFYNAKTSKKDRDEGLEEFEAIKCSMMASNDNIDEYGNFTGMLKGRNTMRKNTHPTVKPTTLMQYLVRLVTPKGGTILDPFNGSGSTGKATMYENRERQANYKYIGIELTEEYLPIARARIEYVCNLPEEKEEKSNQITFEDLEKINEIYN